MEPEPKELPLEQIENPDFSEEECRIMDEIWDRRGAELLRRAADGPRAVPAPEPPAAAAEISDR
jgi:hypothetical protein